MEADFWHDMWESGIVGFHQADINAYLKNHWQKLGLNGDEKVLVPLCGKSLDMVWLAQQGHEVLGVELSQKALDEFLIENGIDAKPHRSENYCGYELPSMTLLCGDFFDLTSAHCDKVSVVYDRAALVALPPEMRKLYVNHLKSILPTGTRQLLVTMEYDQSKLQGPPFSVSENEVRELYTGFDIEKVEESNLNRKGVEALEKVFLIK
jgi:thiopurine S-methyltransferase